MKLVCTLLLALGVSFAQSGKTLSHGSQYDCIYTEGEQDHYEIEGGKKATDAVEITLTKQILETKDVANAKTKVTPRILVTLAEAETLKVHGGGTLLNDVSITQPLVIMLDGEGSFDLQLNVQKDQPVRVVADGDGTIRLQGFAKNLVVEARGNVDVEAADLQTNSCEVTHYGLGNVKVQVSDTLKATNKGPGDIRYTGSAEVEQSTHSTGRIIQD